MQVFSHRRVMYPALGSLVGGLTFPADAMRENCINAVLLRLHSEYRSMFGHGSWSHFASRVWRRLQFCSICVSFLSSEGCLFFALIRLNSSVCLLCKFC